MKHMRLILPVIAAALTLHLSPAFAQKLESKPTMGPNSVQLGTGVGKLNIPKGYAFIGKEDTHRLLEEPGARRDEHILGMIAPETGPGDWFAVLSYIDTGYIKDDEADSMKPDTLLREIKDNTDKENADRKEKGLSTIEVVGWQQPPHYDHVKHSLIWSIIGKESGRSDQVINHTSVVFGREGIMTETVVGDYSKAAALQPKLSAVGNMVTFNVGKDYGSFRSGDRVSDLTMTGLVTGGAAAAAYGAAKLGLLGKLGNYIVLAFLALKKAAIVVVVAIGGAIKALWAKITGRRQSASNSPDLTKPL